MTRSKAEPQVYHDGGCEHFSSCLQCPAPVCKDENPVAFLRWLNQGRDSQVRALTAQGLGPKAISEQMGLGESTVSRIRRGGR